MRKFNIELGENELFLIAEALELYARMGTGQFNYLTDHRGVQKIVWDKNIQVEFDQLAKSLGSIYTGMPVGGSYGIFNNKIHDCNRIALDISYNLRHAEYMSSDKASNIHHKFSRKSDICTIAGIQNPIFKINKIDENV